MRFSPVRLATAFAMLAAAGALAACTTSSASSSSWSAKLTGFGGSSTVSHPQWSQVHLRHRRQRR